MKEYNWLIICHLFYEDESKALLQDLFHLNKDDSFFLFNIHPANNALGEITGIIRKNFKNHVILHIPPKGRDIGAKFQLINFALQQQLKSFYTLIVHDKKSPHLDSGDSWKNELLKIIRPSHLGKVMNVFRTQNDVGIIGSAKYIQNEYRPANDSFACQSNIQVKEILRTYSIKPADFSFIAGNIFWIRSNLLEKFFAERSILQIRAKLEAGNALDFANGTYIHAWERIMSWIATSQGHKLYGI